VRSLSEIRNTRTILVFLLFIEFDRHLKKIGVAEFLTVI